MTDYRISGEELDEFAKGIIDIILKGDSYNEEAIHSFLLLKSKKPIESLNRKKLLELKGDIINNPEYETIKKVFAELESLSPQPEPGKDNMDIVKDFMKKRRCNDIDYIYTGQKCDSHYCIINMDKFAHNLLSKINLEYATPEKIREIINKHTFVAGNIDYEPLIKELSQLAKPSGEVIAEGKAKQVINTWLLRIGELAIANIDANSDLWNLDGQEVKLIIHKCKESK